jgi:hypothetical protein
MASRFQKRVSTPLGRINISKSGVSLTKGVRGAHVTIGRTPRVTLGIPGSGLSWTESMEHGHRASHAHQVANVSRKVCQTGAPQASQARPGWQWR